MTRLSDLPPEEQSRIREQDAKFWELARRYPDVWARSCARYQTEARENGCRRKLEKCERMARAVR